MFMGGGGLGKKMGQQKSQNFQAFDGMDEEFGDMGGFGFGNMGGFGNIGGFGKMGGFGNSTGFSNMGGFKAFNGQKKSQKSS